MDGAADEPGGGDTRRGANVWRRPEQQKLRRGLVGVEVAVSVTLVLMTGLLTASLMRLMRVDRGFDAERVVTAQIDLPVKSYDKDSAREAFYQRTLDAVRRLPGVESAGAVSHAAPERRCVGRHGAAHWRYQAVHGVAGGTLPLDQPRVHGDDSLVAGGWTNPECW